MAPPRNHAQAGPSSSGSTTRTHNRTSSDGPAMPLELFYHVFENLPPSSLTSVAQTSATFNGVCEKVIYRRLELYSVPQALQCFQTLSKKPSAASSVREVVIVISDAKNFATQFLPILSAHLRMLSQIICLHLAIEGPYVNVLDGCHFPFLKTFSSIVDLSPTWAPMVNFLVRHPSITHLCMGGEQPGQEFALPLGALPNLQTYMGSRRLVSAFVPRRPVSRVTLAWHSPNVETEVSCVIPFLSRSSVPLQSFSCATPGWSSVLVRSIAACLPHLRSIRLLNVSTDYFNEAEVCTTLTDVLSTFTELTKLEIPCPRAIQSILTADAEAAAVKTWQALAPKLVSVVFPSRRSWQKSNGKWARAE